MLSAWRSHSSAVIGTNTDPDRRLAEQKECERRGDARREGADRGVAGDRCGAQPDHGEDKDGRPVEAERDADIGGRALAAAEPEPDRVEMAQKSGEVRRAVRPRQFRPAPPTNTAAFPSVRRRARLRRRAVCCRCATHWSRRYCPSRWHGCRRGRRDGSATSRTESSRGDSRSPGQQAPADQRSSRSKVAASCVTFGSRSSGPQDQAEA